MAAIDISQVLARKMPRGSKFIPRWAVRALGRLVHVDELNDILDSCGHLPPQEFIRAVFSRWRITYEASGLDELAVTERYLFAANHPFGGMDGMMLADLLIGRFGDARVVVNDLLMHVEPLRPLWVPVNKHGRQNAAYAHAMSEALAGDLPMLTFPAGLCSRRRHGQVADVEWRKSFVRHAEASGRTIVPVYVEGSLSNRFYRIARLREMTGMKFNAEMVLLPDEMIRQSGSHFNIRFGAPIGADELAAAGSAAEKALYVRGKMEQLAAAAESAAACAGRGE